MDPSGIRALVASFVGGVASCYLCPTVAVLQTYSLVSDMHKKAPQYVRAQSQMADAIGMEVPLDIAWLTSIIPLDFVPREIEISPDEKTLYVAHESGNEISVFSLVEPFDVRSIKGAGAGDITLSPDGKRLYSVGSKKCYVIDTENLTVIRTLASAKVNRIVCSPDGCFICLSFQDMPGGLVRVIRTDDYHVENDFDLGALSNASLALAVSPQSDRIFASVLADGIALSAVSVIDPVGYGQDDIPGFADPRSMAISSDGLRLYVGGIDEVYIADGTSGRMYYREKIGCQGYPVKIIGITPDDRYVYVVYTCNFDVYRVDTVKGTVSCIAYFPSVGGSVLSKAGTRLYTTHSDMSWVSIYQL